MSEEISIITGSTLGAAEYVGDHLGDLLQQKGFDVTVQNAATLDDVIEDKIWLVVTSTHGAGDLPDNLKPLMNRIAEEKTDLSALRFAVAGLGNSDYDTFCLAVDKVENLLLGQGATRLCDSLRIDVLTQADHEQAAENWLPNFIDAL
ncbi:FMN-binding protein MioC [Actinobacillus succinogenes]|uniref:Flavodoxin/nitric oxide synthase n=1 Tax=Actinobacillus succinogenes (strain ATCC 55618 / DSM 22257 / CCUG 43843 / 130Z) TaxID=339671 RepID=A6VLD3_ACTSZ|nr:FMN-binding protein MioC [Actinobacillus succinogenes]ABR73780.1 flavodoxin/nitric oxide synthase [Actinobacillus succinogenes 130Z]PHI39762.1 FMN-binding protein MioC [Actinobacillus succinogenes]